MLEVGGSRLRTERGARGGGFRGVVTNAYLWFQLDIPSSRYLGLFTEVIVSGGGRN
jgi:hypothetical protein